MQEVNVILNNIQIGALDAAVRSSVGSKMIGVSTYGPDRPISIWLEDTATLADKNTAQSVAASHDPVFLSVDKTTIAADGVDAATITVRAPKPGASAVTLLIAGTPTPVTLTSGVGTLQVVADDPAEITIAVQNPANRSTDTLVVEAL